MNKPTEAALKLAEELIPNRELIRYYGGDWDELHKRTALRIDQRLLLPEKHAALLLAQAFVDAHVPGNGNNIVDDLRTALAKIQ